MTTDSIGLFKAMTAKMGYLDKRQEVISQNVANADTPGYRPHDLSKVDFGRVLKEATGSKVIYQEVTNPRHMTGGGDIDNPENRETQYSYEVAPVGNAVILEEQMVNAAKTTMDYNLMSTLYQKNVNMIRTAIGRGQ